MPLNTTKLNQDIKSALDKQKSNTGDQDAAIATLAAELTQAIDAYVRSGTVRTSVVTNPGQSVQVAIPAGTGTTIAPGSGNGTGQVV